MITSGDGRTKVWLRMERAGEDVILILGGGDEPHIGGIVLAVPGKGIERIVMADHRDMDVLAPLAEEAVKHFERTVVATGGIHIENATRDEIAEAVENCRALAERLDDLM